MKIAILGAGMSGLSCAITLEKHGIEPAIFEKRSRVGDRFVNAEATFSILNRPVRDGITYLANTHGIHLSPVDTVRELVFHSKNQTGTIRGNLGYTNIRGRHENSYEVQLQRQTKSKIYFNSQYEYEDLCREFEYVILAPGDGEYASHLGNYRCDLTCTVRGATLEGKFVTSTPHVWFNYDIIPKGYVFLIPYSDMEANFSIAYPDYPDNIKLDINQMWSRMYDILCRELNQSLRVTDKFEVTRYMMGICNKPKIDNTYYVGNCFGTIAPGLGFGQFTSVLTGVYAAYDILGMGKYEELVKPLFKNYENSLVLRRFLENLDDDKLDLIIKNLDNKLVDGLIDKITSSDSSLEVLGSLTPILKLWNSIKGNTT